MAKNHYVDLAKIRNGPAQGPMVIAEHGPEKTGVNALMSQTLPAAMLLSGSLYFIFSRLL
ncbi:MAG TPA: hypothetical protein VGI22_23660 [Xanthobacteraceae bacterium]|jgi:hypothetical protein